MSCLEIFCKACKHTTMANTKQCDKCGTKDPELLHISFDEASDSHDYDDDGGCDDE